jgi:hypothetical protein
MANYKLTSEVTSLPGGPYDGEMFFWTPPAFPWAFSWDLEDMEQQGYVEYIDGTRMVYANVATTWVDINERLKGAKPNRWIDLDSAVWIIAKKLGLLPGQAQELLRTKAIPPAIPWVGMCIILQDDGTRRHELMVIERGPFTRADIHFHSDQIYFPGQDEPVWEPKPELNHLEAWIAEYEAQQPQLASRRADSGAGVPDPYRNGFPGRPSIRHLIDAEFRRRAGAGEMLPGVGKEAQVLYEWAAANHPKAQLPTPGAIENLIRDSHRKLRSTK